MSSFLLVCERHSRTELQLMSGTHRLVGYNQLNPSSDIHAKHKIYISSNVSRRVSMSYFERMDVLM